MATINFISIINNDEGNYKGNLHYYFKQSFFASNSENPYHNFRHALHVMCQSYAAGKYEKIGAEDMRALLISALAHDYGHSGLIGGDDRREIEVVLKFLKNNLLAEDKNSLSHIEGLVSATCFPHATDLKLSPSMKIIRDADLSQTLFDLCLQQNVLGLAKEMGMSALELLENQAAFFSTLNFQSKWGKTFLQPQIPRKIEELKEILSILKYS